MPALTAPFPLIFLWNLFISFEAKLLTNPGKLSLAKGIARSVSVFFLNFLTANQKIYLIELILVVCLVVRNNSCGNSSSSKFFLFILNIVLVIFFAADFNLFSRVFVSLTHASWQFAIIYTVTLS